MLGISPIEMARRLNGKAGNGPNGPFVTFPGPEAANAIAARAGVCRTTAQNAIRQAQRLGLLIRIERRRAGRPSLTNIVRIVCREWLTWLRIGKPGLKKSITAGSSLKRKARTTDASPSKGEPSRGRAAERRDL